MSLQNLPPELTERIVVLLPLPDIGSLRLTSRCLASKTAQKHFKARFRTKTVELTERRLRSFVDVTASGGLGCLLQDLTLAAPVYSTSELANRLEESAAQVAELDDNGQFIGLDFHDLTEDEVRQTERDLVALQKRQAEQLNFQRHRNDAELLGQAFSNLATHRASIRMLRAEVEVYQDNTPTPLLPLFGGNKKPIWAAAANASHALFASFTTACNLSVEGLDLFNSSRMLRCSLSYNELNSFDFASVRRASFLGHLAKLSLSISDRMGGQSSRGEVVEERSQQSSFDGFRSMLRTCSSLKKLDLAYFSLDHVGETNLQCGHIIQAMGESNLSLLRHLKLQGFDTTEGKLFALLQGLPTLRSLSLRYIKLTDGSFKRVLDYCTMEAAMEEVELDCLHEPNIVMFEPPWAVVETPPKGYPRTRAFYQRSSDDAAGHEIKHYVYQGHALDSGSIKSWGQDLKNWFGPLPENGKPSCLQPYVRAEDTWRYR